MSKKKRVIARVMSLIFKIVYYGFQWAKLVIKNKNQTFFTTIKIIVTIQQIVPTP